MPSARRTELDMIAPAPETTQGAKAPWRLTVSRQRGTSRLEIPTRAIFVKGTQNFASIAKPACCRTTAQSPTESHSRSQWEATRNVSACEARDPTLRINPLRYRNTSECRNQSASQPQSADSLVPRLVLRSDNHEEYSDRWRPKRVSTSDHNWYSRPPHSVVS